MPTIDPLILKKALTEAVLIVGEKWVKHRSAQLAPYDSDGLPEYRFAPAAVILPSSRDELCAVVKILYKLGVPFVPRGAGTGLSGGSLADGIVIIGLNRLNRIHSIDANNRLAHVEPGVVNAKLSKAAAKFNLYYAPDPSSQTACTIGGNVAENAGGPHCLKYGVTLNHIVALTVCLPNGELLTFGSPYGEIEGYDLCGLFIGSEGCFGIATDIWTKLLPIPESTRTFLIDFTTVNAAAKAVSDIISSGILPAALEMMDQATIQAVEDSIYAAGYPTDAAAVLLVEIDGSSSELDSDTETILRCCSNMGARSIRSATNETERNKLWQGRKKAFGALGRIAPHMVVQDAVVPRTKLPDVLEKISEIGDKYNVRIFNVFHAGDGNLHPNISFDASDTDESKRVHSAMKDIMNLCINSGGTISGEHGVGIDKLQYMDHMFNEASLAAMCSIRHVFDPLNRSNPGKAIPIHSCREWSAPSASWNK